MVCPELPERSTIEELEDFVILLLQPTRETRTYFKDWDKTNGYPREFALARLPQVTVSKPLDSKIRLVSEKDQEVVDVNWGAFSILCAKAAEIRSGDSVENVPSVRVFKLLYNWHLTAYNEEVLEEELQKVDDNRAERILRELAQSCRFWGMYDLKVEKVAKRLIQKWAKSS
jgi:hypothetical protein